MADLNQLRRVSEPTIARFCRKVGFAGFQEFKLGLAQMLGAGLSCLDLGIEPGDAPAVYRQKVFDATINTLIDVRNHIDAGASIDVARRSGASVIGVTDPDSPLAKRCSLVVGAVVPDDTDVYTPSVSRIAHLLVIDVLAVAVALRGGERTAARLHTMKSVLLARRLPFERTERPGISGGKEGRPVA